MSAGAGGFAHRVDRTGRHREQQPELTTPASAMARGSPPPAAIPSQRASAGNRSGPGARVPMPSPILPSDLVSLFGGKSYSFGLSSTPVKKLICRAAYAKSSSNTLSNAHCIRKPEQSIQRSDPVPGSAS